MESEIFEDERTWLIRSGITEVEVHCYGESTGSSADHVKETISVTPGDYLEIKFYSGGDAPNSSARGGDAAALYTSDGTLVAGAAGSGGDATCWTDGGDYWRVRNDAGDAGSSRRNGGDAYQEYYDAVADASGGAAGGSSSNEGEDSYVRSNKSYSEVWTGAGGAGFPGGARGEYDEENDPSTLSDRIAKAAAGGGGGMSHGNVQGRHGGNARVEIKHPEPEVVWSNPNLSTSFNSPTLEMSLSWNEAEDFAGDYKIYRREVGGSYEQIGQVPYGTKSFTDEKPDWGEYEYRVSASDGSVGFVDSEIDVDTFVGFGTLTVNGEEKPIRRKNAEIGGQELVISNLTIEQHD